MPQRKLKHLFLSPFLGPVLIILLLWLDFIWIVHREWTYNDQYSYGWLTLILLIYLIYVRLSDRPEGRSNKTRVGGFVLLSMVALTINRIILGSNPEWRLAIVLHTVTILSLTMVLLWKMGGWPWLRHYAPAFALMLFAVPWPTFLENSVTGSLMRAVTSIVVESMNLCGIYAEQSGNLIRLRNGWVGIEAACSGVRNFQSTLMSAWFVGELFRFSLAGRGLLLLISGIASLVLNVVRTWILTWATHRSGSSLTESMHDPVGHAVSLIAFFILLGVAFLLRKYFLLETVTHQQSKAALVAGTSPSDLQHSKLLSPSAWIAAIALLVGGYVFTELWYYRFERSLPEPQTVELNWQSLDAEIEFVDISPAIRGQLKYSDGIHAKWAEANKQIKWTVFSFSWTEGTVSPFIDVHRPETCLPASGFKKGASHSPLQIGIDDRQIQFDAHTFYFMNRPIQVYYATWNDRWDENVPFVRTTADRLRLAWSGRRLSNRRSLQIIVEGIADENVARAKVQDFLEQTVRW
ncbi:MAG TPA: hypothetical protein DCX06_03425 [Opitutae bacterium]|nr:hypothetical protein [Opitutae bacterium]